MPIFESPLKIQTIRVRAFVCFFRMGRDSHTPDVNTNDDDIAAQKRSFAAYGKPPRGAVNYLRNFAVCSIVLVGCLLVFAFCVWMFFAPYSKAWAERNEVRKNAALYLKQDVCTKPELRAALGGHNLCESSRRTVEESVWWNALVDTCLQIFCANNRCFSFTTLITTWLWWIVLVAVLLWVLVFTASSIFTLRNWIYHAATAATLNKSRTRFVASEDGINMRHYGTVAWGGPSKRRQVAYVTDVYDDVPPATAAPPLEEESQFVSQPAPLARVTYGY